LSFPFAFAFTFTFAFAFAFAFTFASRSCSEGRHGLQEVTSFEEAPFLPVWEEDHQIARGANLGGRVIDPASSTVGTRTAGDDSRTIDGDQEAFPIEADLISPRGKLLIDDSGCLPDDERNRQSRTRRDNRIFRARGETEQDGSQHPDLAHSLKLRSSVQELSGQTRDPA